MHWSSFADFLAMGGYGLYVWGSFGMTAGIVAWELITLAKARRRALDEVRNWRLLNTGDDHDATP
ncbi:MAG: heme exporter protein CcmD [Rubrivivax sp.]|nr:heme exporter protein CcmD [Rubrivivax sp.]